MATIPQKRIFFQTPSVEPIMRILSGQIHNHLIHWGLFSSKREFRSNQRYTPFSFNDLVSAMSF